MKKMMLFLCVILSPVYAFCQLDANGWTKLDPAKSKKVVYVSTSGNDGTALVYNLPSTVLGSNPQLPAQTVRPFRSIAAAEAKIADGEAAWILLKTGETFFETISPKSGKSSTEPLVYSYYGTGTQVPVLKVGAGNGIAKCCRSIKNLTVVGLSFYAHTRNPQDPAYSGSAGGNNIALYAGEGHSVQNILIEGCVFRFFKNGTINGIGTKSNIKLRRNVIVDNYSDNAHSQGLFTSGVNGITLEENIFDHNGWLVQSTGGNVQTGGQATMFNHNTYFEGAHNTVFRGNSFFRSSSIGTKWTANHGPASVTNIVISNNVYYDCEIGISIGGNETAPAYRFKNISITENTFSAAGKSRQTNRTLGWGVDINDWDGGSLSNNYFLHQTNDAVTNGHGIELSGETRNVQIRNNILHNLKYTTGMIVKSQGLSGVSVANNKFNLNLTSSRYFVNIDIAKSMFSGNTYSGTATGNQFRIGSSNLGYSAWISGVGETGSSTTAPNFSSPSRSVDTYITNVLGLSGVSTFYTELRKLSRLNWKKQYTAPEMNKWIKAGFSIVAAREADEESTEINNDAFNTESTVVYPNPTNGIVTVAAKGDITVRNTLGQTVFSGESTGEREIDLSSEKEGLYIIEIKNGEDVIVKKLQIR